MRLLSWGPVVAVTGLVTAAVVVPRLAGATPSTVLTGSMAPAHPAGSLVVVRPVDIDEVRTGDVITYQLCSGELAVATQVLTTRGDATSVADAQPVREVWLADRDGVEHLLRPGVGRGAPRDLCRLRLSGPVWRSGSTC